MSDSSSGAELGSPFLSKLVDNRYRIESLIGRGGMGDVFRATDERLQRPVAIKILTGANRTTSRSLETEVRTLATCVHPNLVRLLDVGEIDGRLFLVMDLVDGKTLATCLLEGPIPEGDVLRVGADIAGALEYVHGRGIVHRDVKPANILIDRAGISHLADFGIARLIDSTGETSTGATLGTPAYLAPEQVLGRDIGPFTDIYALGLVLIECLTGRRAFVGTHSEVVATRLHRQPDFPPGLSLDLLALLTEMTSIDSESRPVAHEVRARLLGLSAGEGPALTLRVATRSAFVPAAAGALIGASDQVGGVVDTQLLRRPPVATSPFHRLAKWRRSGLAVLGVMIILALVLGATIGGLFNSSPRPTGGSKTTSTTSPIRQASQVQPLSAVAKSATAFESDVASATRSGKITQPAGSQLISEIGPLAIPGTSPSLQSEQQLFDQLAQTYLNDVANGSVQGASTITTLNGALQNLATTLHTSVPTTTTSTTVLPGPGPGPGQGHGNH